MIIKIRRQYNIVSDYTVNDALVSCIVKRDSNHLVNTMELTYKRDGEYADSFVIGALLWGIYGTFTVRKTDVYIITYIKKTDKEIKVTAEETCRYIFRRCAVYPMSSSGTLADAISAMYYRASPRPDYTDRYYYLLDTTYGTGVSSINCEIDFKVPITLLDALKGSEGSIADITHLQIRLFSRIRSDGLDIRVHFNEYDNTISDFIVSGREIIESSIERDLQYWPREIVPFWKGTYEDVETVVTNGTAFLGGTTYLCSATDIVDVSSRFTEKPTPSAVWDAAVKIARETRSKFEDGNYYVKIQDGATTRRLSTTGESSALRSIDAGIGNLISVTFENGSKIAARVTSTEYDMLREIYTKIDLGEKIDNFSRMLAKDIKGN